MLTDLTNISRIASSDIPDERVIFGSALALEDVRKNIDRTLTSDLPVLIQGENGTGRGLAAKYIHNRSCGENAPFVKMNCSETPFTTLENMLLSNKVLLEAGSVGSAPASFEAFRRATIFLDEFGEMDRMLQVRLAQLIQHRWNSGLANSNDGKVRVRVVCAIRIDAGSALDGHAAHRSVLSEIDAICLRLLPLRERKGDIPQLAEYFFQKLGTKFGKSVRQLAPATLLTLAQWHWPGNLRELENWIARVVILGSEEESTKELAGQVALTRRIGNSHERDGVDVRVPRQSEAGAVQEAILKALQSNGWSRRRTAEELKMSYRALLHMLRDVNVPRRRKNHSELPPMR
jgi:DNA-binding NtrC family response regulator